MNLRILVCPDCYDKPQESGRTLHLPPDPVGVQNARPENYVSADNPIATLGFNVADMFTYPPSFGQVGVSNLLLRSQTFDISPWFLNAASVTANVTTAPDGTLTAYKLTPDTTNNFHFVQQNVTAVPSGAIVCLSFFVKPAGYNFAEVEISDDIASGFNAMANLTTGTIISQGGFGAGVVITSGIQALANGWFRIFVVGTTPSIYGASLLSFATGVTVTFAGDGVSGTYVWGAQLELGMSPSTYVPTTTAIVTTPATYATIGGANIGTMVNNGGVDAAFFAAGQSSAFNSTSATALFSPATAGLINKRMEVCAALSVSSPSFENTVGKNWNAVPSGINLTTPSTVAAIQHTVSGFAAYAPNDQPFLRAGATGWLFQGSNDGKNWTTLSSGTTAGTIGETLTATVTATNAYGYHLFALQGDGFSSVGIAGLSISISDAAPNDI